MAKKSPSKQTEKKARQNEQKKPDASKKRRLAVSKEIKRLNEIYQDLPPERLEANESLIRDAADLRIRIVETQEDLNVNGYDTMFQQTIDVAPYERERPAAKRLIALQKNLLAIVKELNTHLPKPDQKPKEESDGFDEFVNDR